MDRFPSTGTPSVVLNRSTIHKEGATQFEPRLVLMEWLVIAVG